MDGKSLLDEPRCLMCRRSCLCVLLISAPIGAVAAGNPVEVAGRELQFFETSIRPLLAKHCFPCHSAQAEKLRGGLRLDHADGVRLGGDSGPVLTPGHPDASLLIQAVRYDSLEMPPTQQLPQRDIELLWRWIRAGAHFPAESKESTSELRQSSRKVFKITPEDRAHWAYQSIRRPRVPPIPRDGVANPIDAFVLRRLQAANIEPNPVAEPRTLVRRLWFDLIGLPPDPSEVDAFTEQPSDDAWDRLIDRLLSHTTYGERWGRHWLDLVRFAQTNGYERDAEKPFAWRYRDYVIQSLNEDKPFDQFVMEQLAGDELQPADFDSIIATAFYRLDVWDDEPDDAVVAEYDGLDNILSTIGQVFLGQTVGCARCHDHMFDPISQRDYYKLLAFIRNIRPYEEPRYQLDSAILAPLATLAFLDNWRSQQNAQVAALRQPREQPAIDKGVGTEIDTKLAASRPVETTVPWTLAVRDRVTAVQPTHVLIRGDARTPGARVDPGVPDIFNHTGPGVLAHADPPAASEIRGRRLALAGWIASPSNPLTARVIANRVWQHHFGRGIVATPNDFGRVGAQPTHPDLLDWLATELIESGWSIKHLHRLILRSNTWRMSSRMENRQALREDPDNRLFWRQNARRLEAEAIRDSVLAVADELNREVGGRGFHPEFAGEVLAGQSKPGFGWAVSSQAQRRRRSVYSYLKRGLRDPLMETFDYVNTDSALGVRPTTTVATQSLMLLNSRFMLDAAQSLAQRVSTKVGFEPTAQIHALYRRLFGRIPTSQEEAIAARYLSTQEDHFERLANVISFRPDVPASLYSEYRRALSPQQYLRGPQDGWSYFVGTWRAGYEGIESVDSREGPFALCTDVQFSSGTIQGKLRLEASTEVATLLMRARAMTDSWTGIAVALDPRSGKIFVTKNTGGVIERFSADWGGTAGRWLPFRIESTPTTIRFTVDGAEPIHMDVSAHTVGHFGVAAWGGPISFDNLRIKPSRTESSMPHGWKYSGGEWTNSDDGTWLVRQSKRANVIRTYERIENGEVSVDVRFTPGKASKAGLLLRANSTKVGDGSWHGYEVSLDAEMQIVSLMNRHGNRIERSVPARNVEPGNWHRLLVTMHGQLISVFVDDSLEPAIRFVDPNPLSAGFIGLQASNSDAAFRHLEIRTGTQVSREDFRPPQVVSPRDPTSSRRRALVALCQVLMNLNEFVYVD